MANDSMYAFDPTKGMRLERTPDRWPEHYYQTLNQQPSEAVDPQAICRKGQKSKIVLLGKVGRNADLGRKDVTGFTRITCRNLYGGETPAAILPRLCESWRLPTAKPYNVHELRPVYLPDEDCTVYVYRFVGKIEDFLNNYENMKLNPREVRNRIRSFIRGDGFFHTRNKPVASAPKLASLLAALQPVLATP